MPRELEGTSMQVYFSPNNEEPGTDKEGGARDRMHGQRTAQSDKKQHERGFVISVTSGSPNPQLPK